MATERMTATAGVSAWLVRALLLVAAGLFLWWGQSQASVLRADLFVPATSETTLAPVSAAPEAARFWWSIVLFALAGLGFGLATRFPFPRPRFAIGRLVLAAIGLVPAVHYWFYRSGDEPRWRDVLAQGYWFDDLTVIVVGAALAGVAIASGVGARRGRG